MQEDKGTSINDVRCFLAIFDLPTLTYPITSDLGGGGYLGPPLPTLTSDVINGRSLMISKINQGNCLGCLGGDDAPAYFPYPKVEHIRHHRHPYLQVITYFGARHIYLSRQKSFSGNIWRQGWLYECAQFFGHERGRAIFYSALLHRYKTLS